MNIINLVAAYVNGTHANHFQHRYLSERLHSDRLADSCVHSTERFAFSANAFDRDTIAHCVWPAAQLTHRHPFDHDRAHCMHWVTWLRRRSFVRGKPTAFLLATLFLWLLCLRWFAFCYSLFHIFVHWLQPISYCLLLFLFY